MKSILQFVETPNPLERALKILAKYMSEIELEKLEIKERTIYHFAPMFSGPITVTYESGYMDQAIPLTFGGGSSRGSPALRTYTMPTTPIPPPPPADED